MRENKYRGWNKEQNKWIYGTPYKVGNEWYIIDNMFKQPNPTHRNADNFDIIAEGELVESETISQFTGLQDFNGNDIYEDDIVDFVVDHGAEGIDSTEDCRAKVYYDTCSIEPFEDISCGHFLENYEFKVIGNIHQNKELLEGKE